LDNVEERVAFLEGRVEGHTAMIDDIRETGARLEARFDRLEARLDQRFASIDTRFAGIDARLDKMSTQLSRVILGVAVAAISGLLGIVTALVR
jgi:hypothetical protein